jgi:ferric-dicitrate binding protein FerR (iron transport regulator)
MMTQSLGMTMTERPPFSSGIGSDEELERTLTDVLQPPPLDSQALERIRVAVENEWRTSTALRRRSRAIRRWRWASLAAAVLVIALTTTWFAKHTAEPAVFGSISRSDGNGIDVNFASIRRRTLHVGDPLRAGDRVRPRGPMLVLLASGGSLRIAADSAVDITSAAEIRLEHGKIYVDKPPAPAASERLNVWTHAGMIEHVGTGFEVLSDAAGVRIRVREGRIRLRDTSGAAGSSNVVLADAGTELLAVPGGGILQRPVATYGADWLWIASLAPTYEIEGQPLLDFLQWVSRELGRRLEFGDSHAREVAARTILHGSIRDHAPLDALANVLATTSLRYEILDDTIRVNSDR